MNRDEADYLPNGWAATTLNHICTIVSGVGFPKTLQGSKSGTYPFYKVGDISKSWLNGDSLLSGANHYLDGAGLKLLRAKPLPSGSIVMAKIGEAIKLNRRAILSAESLVDNNVMGWIPQSRTVNSKLVYYWSLTCKLEEFCQATTVPSVRLSDIGRIYFLLPPANEQIRIVAEIEKQFSRLDAAVTALKRVQTNLKRYRAAVLQAACEGRLVPTEAEIARQEGRNYEPADVLLQRILCERRAQWEAEQLAKMEAQGRLPLNHTWKSKFQEPLAFDAINLPEVPEGWTWATIEQLAHIGTGATPLRGKPAYYHQGTISWVTSGALNQSFVDSADEYITPTAVAETNAKVFPVGTLLLAMYGEGKTRGKVSELRIRAATNQACAALVLEGLANACKPYVKAFLHKNYEDIRRLASGGVQPNLNLSLVRQTSVPIPPLAEQERIVAELERKLSIVDEVEVTIVADLKRAERLRLAILQRAFSGKLVPQDPDDEPASVLLERIRAEREGKLTAKVATKLKGAKRASPEVYTPKLF